MKQLVVLTLISLMLSACTHPLSESNRLGAETIQNDTAYTQAFEAYQIIGEGTDFLTVQIDMPQPLASGQQISALAIDENGAPLRKVSSYAYNSEFGNGHSLWFYIFLYAPRGTHPIPVSHTIQFSLTRDNTILSERSANLFKRWGHRDKAEIFDLPAPPNQINGYLVLKDYTFLADGDPRSPDGYFIEGKIIGKRGHWSQFVPASEILGIETEKMRPPFPTDQGWLELANGKTHSMQEAVAPIEPYVEGWWDAKGYFHPQPRKIYR